MFPETVTLSTVRFDPQHANIPPPELLVTSVSEIDIVEASQSIPPPPPY